MLDFSVDARGEPQFIYADGHVVRLESWDGAQWGTSYLVDCWIGDGAAARVSPSGETYVASGALSLSSCSKAYQQRQLGVVLQDAPSGNLPLAFDRRGLPVLVWNEFQTICGTRWTSGGWQPLPSDASCSGRPTNGRLSPHYDVRTETLVACDWYETWECSDHGIHVRCSRHNEYVRTTPFIPLERFVINEGRGGSAVGRGPYEFRVAFTPADATDKSLTWKVCAGPAQACSPDPTGHCRTCSDAPALGTITAAGVFTPAPSLPLPARVHVLACQRAICDWSSVDVSR
jgi:hypothetical protein